MDFEKSGGISVCEDISSEITNGSISVGIGASNGMLKVTYIIKEKVWETSASEQYLYVKISYTFRNKPVSDALIKQVNYAHAVFATSTSIILIACAIAFTPVTGGVLVTYFIDFLNALLTHIYSLNK